MEGNLVLPLGDRLQIQPHIRPKGVPASFLYVSIIDEHGDFRRFLTEAELEPLCKRIEDMLNGA